MAALDRLLVEMLLVGLKDFLPLQRASCQCQAGIGEIIEGQDQCRNPHPAPGQFDQQPAQQESAHGACQYENDISPSAVTVDVRPSTTQPAMKLKGAEDQRQSAGNDVGSCRPGYGFEMFLE